MAELAHDLTCKTTVQIVMMQVRVGVKTILTTPSK